MEADEASAEVEVEVDVEAEADTQKKETNGTKSIIILLKGGKTLK